MKIPHGFELKRRIKSFGIETRIVEQNQKFWAEKPQQLDGYASTGIYNGIGVERGGWTGTDYEIKKLRKKDKVLSPELEEILLLACSLAIDGIRSKSPTSDHYALARALISLSNQGSTITDFVVRDLRRENDTEIITYEVVAVGYMPVKTGITKT